MSYRTAELRGIIARARPDGSLFDAALRGDPVAFAEIYRRYHSRVYAYCLSRVMDQQLAEDACQETFVRFLHADPGSVPNPRAWLFAVARNVSVDLIRQRSRIDASSDLTDKDETLAGVAVDSGEALLAREKGRAIMLAIRRLRPRYRSALILRELHGLSSVEIAEALGMTPGAVDTLVSRARDAFGTAYAEVSQLPAECGEVFPLIYKRFGTGLDEAEQERLDRHAETCERCSAELKRADKPDRLSAALPFLLPLGAKGASGGLARILASVDPSLASAPVVAVPNVPLIEHVGTKVAAVALAVTVVSAPMGTAVVRNDRVGAARPTAVASAQSKRAPRPSRSVSSGHGATTNAPATVAQDRHHLAATGSANVSRSHSAPIAEARSGQADGAPPAGKTKKNTKPGAGSTAKPLKAAADKTADASNGARPKRKPVAQKKRKPNAPSKSAARPKATAKAKAGASRSKQARQARGGGSSAAGATSSALETGS